MPNWCDNRLEIRGSKESVENAIERYRAKNSRLADRSLSLASIVPEPDQHELPTEGLMPGWYSWRIREWGCKWDITAIWDHVEQVEREDDVWCAKCVFSSAWSPPLAAIAKLADEFPGHVLLDYVEPGVGYSGMAVWEAGYLVYEDEGDTHHTQFGRDTYPPVECEMEFLEDGEAVGVVVEEDEHKGHLTLGE